MGKWRCRLLSSLASCRQHCCSPSRSALESGAASKDANPGIIAHTTNVSPLARRIARSISPCTTAGTSGSDCSEFPGFATLASTIGLCSPCVYPKFGSEPESLILDGFVRSLVIPTAPDCHETTSCQGRTRRTASIAPAFAPPRLRLTSSSTSVSGDCGVRGQKTKASYGASPTCCVKSSLHRVHASHNTCGIPMLAGSTDVDQGDGTNASTSGGFGPGRAS
eukprot:scaffold188659_cov30-Tisochrysis_lutea.AAC.2